MTILEVVVAMALLTSAIFAGVSTFEAVSRSTVALGHRTRAVEIAEREIETMRSVAYSRIGLSPTDVGFVATFEKAPTVRVADPVIAPTSAVSEGGASFTVERHVTWVDVTAPTGEFTLGAYKHLTVVVSWADAASGSVRLDSGVSPYSQPPVCARRDLDGSPSPVQGVVNGFFAGLSDVAAGATVLRVQDAGRGPTKLSPGDLLIVIQMLGPDAGTYEYARAGSALSGDRIAVTGEGSGSGLRNSYSVADRFQVVRVPTYGSVTIGNVTTVPWDGQTGGVLALDVAGVATMAGTLDASSTGFEDVSAPTVVATSRRLLPGKGDVAGGGLVMLRASSITGAGVVAADGEGGGTVMVATESGGLDALSIVARGTGGGDGGSTALTSPPGASDLSAVAPGRAGATSVVRELGDLVGTSLGVGCLPSLWITNAITKNQVVNDGTASAEYTLTVRSAPGRGTATGVSVTDPLPGGFTYLSTSSVAVANGTVRDASTDPTLGDTGPRWGTFTVPAGGTITIVFTAAISKAVPPGVVGDGARVDYAMAQGSAVGVYDEAMSNSDDLTVRAFACAAPFTDAAPAGGLSGIVNTYYPGAATVAAGATALRVGAPIGSAQPIATGDMLLVIQMQGSTMNTSNNTNYGDGPGGVSASGSTALNNAGNYEYAVATGPVTGGIVPVAGSGMSGGLMYAYDSAAATATLGQRTFQVVRVPSYPDVKLVSLVAAPWNGSVGGVVAVDVTGVLDLANGSATVSAAGFRGAGSVARTTINTTYRDTTGAKGGAKGEGVAGTPRSLFVKGSVVDLGVDGDPTGGFGQGAPGNAGGGGGVSAGGGGGANGGNGGNGGKSTIKGYGYGGSLPALATSKALLGGGGGTTQLAVGQTNVGGGGQGGGAMFLRSAAITGTGAINADGGNGTPGSKPSGTEIGGSGGGAGGTVVISTSTPSLATLTVSARGGSGGAVANPASTVAGPGGGGGGGRILSTMDLSSSVTGGVGGLPTTGTYRSASGLDGRFNKVSASDVAGQGLGQGCRPLLVVTKRTTTPSRLRVQGSTAQWIATVTNAAGHLGALSIAITDTLPAGFAYSSTDAVTLSGGATRSSVTNPTVGQTVPSWGSFDIPAGGSVGITFSATHSGGALGVIGNSVQAGASYFGLTVASRYSDTDGTADDVTLADPVSTVFAHTMVEQLTSAAVTTTADELWSTDARTVTTGAFPVTSDPKRYLDVDYRAPLMPVQSPSMQPQPASVSVVLAMAAPNVAARSCFTIQVGSATTAVFHTAIAAPVCVTGTTITPTTVVLPARTWVGGDFSDLRVRLTGTSTASIGTVVDQVGVNVAWQGSTFRLQPTSSIDASSGVAAGAKVARGVSGDAVSLTTGGTTAIATTFSSVKYLDLQLPAEIPAGATVGTVRGTFRWSTDTSATACWYLDVRTAGARVGGVGTSGASTCHAGANVASSDTVVFPALTLAQVNDLTARVYFKTTSGSAKTVSVDQFSLDVTWSRP